MNWAIKLFEMRYKYLKYGMGSETRKIIGINTLQERQRAE
jgi:hypothetical protein